MSVYSINLKCANCFTIFQKEFPHGFEVIERGVFINDRSIHNEKDETIECPHCGSINIRKTEDIQGIKIVGGVGMPATLYLDEFGSQVWSAFGKPPYLVGSALESKQWRDVDVRLILDDEIYKAMELGDPSCTHTNAKWVSLCLAYSALGKAITGLPIDFQIQQQSDANKNFKGPRSALGMLELRTQKNISEG
ncbi:MAG: hypothetical protein RDU14_17025 [Melioribacteraceae bacterium]|nr:hypothetical protein [Melioribacteraceae bacterium]